MRISKQVINAFLITLIYGICFLLLQVVLKKLGMVANSPTAENLMRFDALWYESIAERGYYYARGGGQANAGFYPLLPWIWKLLHLGVWGRIVLNIILLATGFAVFTAVFKTDLITKLIWLTVPSFFYIYIPYSEALFFFLCAILIWSIRYEKRYATWLVLLFLPLARPVAVVIAPALLAVSLLSNDNKHWYRSLLHYVVTYLWPMLIGFTIFVIYQYMEVGVWFAYFKIQTAAWGHELKMPKLPFGSMFGYKSLWLNAISLFIGFLCLIALVIKGLKWLLKNQKEGDKLLLLSMLYFTGVGLEIILFNPMWEIGTTNVYGLHRYALTSVFFLILLWKYIHTRTYKWKHAIMLLLASSVFWLLFASYRDAERLLYFSLTSLYLMLYILTAINKMKWTGVILVLVNLAMQTLLFQYFISEQFTA